MKGNQKASKTTRRIAEYALVELERSAWAVAYRGICIPGAILRSRFAALMYAAELAVAAGHSSMRLMVARSTPGHRHALKAA